MQLKTKKLLKSSLCDPAGTRTQGPIIKSDVLYQLSYEIIPLFEFWECKSMCIFFLPKFFKKYFENKFTRKGILEFVIQTLSNPYVVLNVKFVKPLFVLLQYFLKYHPQTKFHLLITDDL